MCRSAFRTSKLEPMWTAGGPTSPEQPTLLNSIIGSWPWSWGIKSLRCCKFPAPMQPDANISRRAMRNVGRAL
jgi:hypothetical protein